MLCEMCRQNFATAFASVLVEEIEQEFYLCQNCLNKKNLSQSSKILSEEQQESKDSICTCGTTFNEIKESGYVNCKECYKTFENELQPFILKVHSHTSHRGKRKLSRLEILKEQLRKARENNFVSLAIKIESEIEILKGDE